MKETYPIVYAVKHKDKNIIAESRSGGFFTAISDIILDDNGVIYGCTLNEELKVVHSRTDNVNGRNKMRGSKYVQSDLGNCFGLVKSDLELGKKVLFTGTPCQIEGLKSFLGSDYDKLISVDLVCYGVPSPKVFRDYISWLETKYSKKVQSIDFRNKEKFGWRAHIETIYFDDGSVIDSRVFRDLFSSHLIQRPACFECKFKPLKKNSDITIADYWNIENVAKDFDDDKGVSLVMVNSPKGLEYFNRCKNQVIYKETDYYSSIQPSMLNPYKRPRGRKNFWKKYSKKEFDYIAKRYSEYGEWYKLKRKIRKKIRIGIWNIKKYFKR